MRNYPKLHPRERYLVEGGGRPARAAGGPRGLRPVRLEHRNIEVLLNTRLESAEEIIPLSDGQAFALMFAEHGLDSGREKAVAARLGRGYSRRFVMVKHLRAVGIRHAWAAGDIVAAIPDCTTQGLCTLRRRNTREGRRLGRNVTATFFGRRALAPFVWKNVPLGRYKGVANVFGINVKGFLGWFLHRATAGYADDRVDAIHWTIALRCGDHQFGSFELPATVPPRGRA